MTMQTEAARNDSGEPPYDPDVWGQKDFTERVQQAARDYVLRGMGYPASVYVFHVVKILALASGWMFWVSFTPGLGNPLTIGEWIFHPMALQKAFIWGCMFETLGFGCMSGPLGLKVWPPFTAFLHYLRPGATKLAWRPDLPVLGGYTRSWLDVTLYALFVLSMGWALVQPEITAVHLVPIIVLLPLAALGDRMIFLTSRGEHHWAMIVIFLLCGPWFTGSSTSWIAGAKWVQLSIWFWAGVSKLTVAFAYVVPVMTANNPMLKNPEFRRRLFKSWPDDLQPSTLGKVMAHAGTFLEFAAPLTLIWVTQSGPLLYLGMFWVIMLHGFIISNVPIAAVFEWNLLSLYAGFFLFWAHPEVSLFSVGSDLAAVYLVVGCLIVPLLGNLAPSWISFLTSMRYYAGNWAWNAWLFHENAHKKLHKLKRAAPLLLEQQQKALPPEEANRVDASFLAFRTLHLQGRILGMLLPRAIGDTKYQEWTYADGETLAGSVLGWNFGEGHLADETLLEAIQNQVGFDEGEVRVICVEAQPILGSTLHWRISDARTGLLAEGHAELDELARRKPWDFG